MSQHKTLLTTAFGGLCGLLPRGKVAGSHRARAFVAVVVHPKHGSNLVDSASSHTLVSKIKPCTSENKGFSLNLRMAHYISYSLFDSPLLLG